MRVLGIDTATWTASVGVIEDEETLAERTETTAGSHGASLLTLVGEATGAAGLDLRDLDAIAVSIGPGSFTGLRIGLSTAKGLAFACGLPVVGVPTLEALARASRVTDGLVCPIIDARKGEVYAALYRASGGVVEEMRAPCAVALDAWLASLPGPCTFIGDAVSLLPPGTRVLPFDRFPPSGSAVAACGRVLIERRGPDDLAAIEPLYVRPPEAEIHPIAVR